MNPQWAKRSLVFLWLLITSHAQNFVNFETAPIHPVALSPDGKTLAVCNLPDARVELFDLTQSVPRPIGSVPTGLDPVTARFNHLGELWIANYISDSITIIDPATKKILATLESLDAPADIIFTSNHRAYISHAGANAVQIWDVTNRVAISRIDIDGDRPKAMALSPDQSEIYVAILESGNASTIITPALTNLNVPAPLSVLDSFDNPHHGANPPPNAGLAFFPPINPAAPNPPKASLIVRKQQGRWMDDNNGDWTQYISGTNAPLTGRPPGWDTTDHDIAVINATNGAVRYIRGLMNICFDLSVNPANGQIALIGTDAINEVRFEPLLQSIFIRMKLALVDPKNSASQILDLNPHLDYQTKTLPAHERRQSIGDPRGIAWNATGAKAYVTGMGSDNLIVLDPAGARIGSPIQLPEGPTALVVDDARHRLYIFSRFASKLLTLDMDSLALLNAISLPDSTPAPVRLGRKHFYNTQKNSGLGQASCASCHIDGRFDRLAWDLGNPADSKTNFNEIWFLTTPLSGSFHPMKGPMVTQTLFDIIGHEPFHWRGDRAGIEQFNSTFVNLQGADRELTDQEMKEFKDFLATLTFPPNPLRNLDNSLPTTLPLPAERSLGRGSLPAGQPMPPGDAQRGVNQFIARCTSCHSLPTGLGFDGILRGFNVGSPRPTFKLVPPGPNGERHHAVIALQRNSNLEFKVAQLRDVREKVGFDLASSSSRSGFGFAHDSRADTLTRFLQDGFPITDDQETSDMIAFLLAFTGSDLPITELTIPVPNPPLPQTFVRFPASLSRDAPAAVGLQASLTNPTPSDRALFMLAHAQNATSRVDLIVHAIRDHAPRAWLMRGPQFISDKSGETNVINDLLTLATPSSPITFTFVPQGSGTDLALDRDGDTYFNQTELDENYDPANPLDNPDITPRLTSFKRNATNLQINFLGRLATRYRIQTRDQLTPQSPWTDQGAPITISTNPTTWSEPIQPAPPTRFFRIIHAP